MGLSTFQLLGHVALIGHATKEQAELVSVLTRGGFSREDIQESIQLAESLEDDLNHLRRGGDLRIHEHASHVASCEVDMWIQTVAMSLGALQDDALRAQALGKGIHTHNHTLSVVMQAQRTIAMLQVHPDVQEAASESGQIKDILNRGWALLGKLGVCTDALIKAASMDSPDWEASRARLNGLVQRLNKSTEMTESPALLAYLGWVPDGIGVSVGGSSYAVTLHERSQRDAPAHGTEQPCPGWSVGRQGQNRENLGKGFIAPTFK
jgi:hypothetical protein